MLTSPLKDRRGSRGVELTGLNGDRNLDARLGRFPCGCFRTCCRKLAAQVALVEAVYILRNSAKPIGVRRVSLLGHKLRCSVETYPLSRSSAILFKPRPDAKAFARTVIAMRSATASRSSAAEAQSSRIALVLPLSGLHGCSGNPT